MVGEGAFTAATAVRAAATASGAGTLTARTLLAYAVAATIVTSGQHTATARVATPLNARLAPPDRTRRVPPDDRVRVVRPEFRTARA